jgi:pyrroline-5-carboxylate reductase
MAISRVGVIGTGVIGEALIKALISFGVAPTSINISEKRDERKSEIIERYGVMPLDSLENVDVLLMAVKPQDFESTVKEFGKFDPGLPLIISFAAGIKIAKISNYFGPAARILRVMPNTPIAMVEACLRSPLGLMRTPMTLIGRRDF